MQRPNPPTLVGGEGKGVLDRVVAYGDEWMPEGRTPVDVLAPRIAELQEAARAAGRTESIPVTVFNPPAEHDHIERLREVGVGRVVLMAPSAESGEVERALDEFAVLAAALAV
jgi:alkanesulfonate monooxygenase SsuD/methylene tetrahydromethanopterin reductase-like flavin-dependent oxidoreductase (luciferase family)